MRHGVRFVDLHAAGPALLGELETQPTLAGAGFRHHADDTALPLNGAGQRRFERRHLVAAADEA